MIYSEELLFINSLDPSVKSSCEVKWQIKNYFSYTGPMDVKHSKMVTYHDGFPSIKLHKPLNTWSREATDKLKTLYFNYRNVYIYFQLI